MCNLLCYLLTIKGEPVPKWIKAGAKDYYGAPTRCHELTVKLCGICDSLTEAQKTAFIYDGRSATARRLADWWDRHEAADRDREAKEMRAKNKAALKEVALSKLTPEERKALNL